MINDELIRYETRWADAFRLLAACFYQPDRDALLEEKVGENLAAALGPISPEAAKFAEQMTEALREESQEDLLVAYSKLFLGPSEHLVPPYGSVYLEQKHQVMGDSTLATLEFYRRAGLSLAEEMKEPPDHIAIELEFMSYLIARKVAAAAAGKGEEAARFALMQQQFIDRFLGRWVPSFCGDMAEASESRFFRLLASCLAHFMASSAPTAADAGKETATIS
jgi:putative dimethyl sulfoxide reductase chaperone